MSAWQWFIAISVWLGGAGFLCWLAGSAMGLASSHPEPPPTGLLTLRGPCEYCHRAAATITRIDTAHRPLHICPGCSDTGDRRGWWTDTKTIERTGK